MTIDYVFSWGSVNQRRLECYFMPRQAKFLILIARHQYYLFMLGAFQSYYLRLVIFDTFIQYCIGGPNQPSCV